MIAKGSRGPYPYHEGLHLIVAVHLPQWVYADESGIHAGAPVCFVAGFRASPIQWKRFSKDWRGVLNKSEYRIKVFHSNEFFNRNLPNVNPAKNPFVGWDDEKADAFLHELLAVLRRRNLHAVYGGVDVAAFESRPYWQRCQMVGYAPGISTKSKRPPAPYHMAVRLMVEDSVGSSAAKTELHFVIAEQKTLQQRALEGYSLTKERWRETFPDKARRLKTMGIASPEDEPALQAADLFAYLWYNWQYLGDGVSKQKYEATRQLARIRNDIGVVTAAGIDRLFSDLSPEQLAELQATREPL